MSFHPSPRLTPDGRTLVSRHVVAFLTKRHLNYVRREVPAVACDVRTRVALVDLDHAEQTLAARSHRARRVA